LIREFVVIVVVAAGSSGSGRQPKVVVAANGRTLHVWKCDLCKKKIK
jgi:CTP:molybdopterin cytidylyltransferase MocA